MSKQGQSASTLTDRRRDTQGCSSPSTGSPLSDSQIERLTALFRDGGSEVKSQPEHWISGGVGNHDHDESKSYCYDCAKKEIARLKQEEPSGEWSVGGGYGGQGDSTPSCESCGVRLENSLTRYGCSVEVSHFLEYGFDPASGDDCRSMHEVIEARGWQFCSAYEKPEEARYFERLHELGRRILSGLANVSGEGAGQLPTNRNQP